MSDFQLTGTLLLSGNLAFVFAAACFLFQRVAGKDECGTLNLLLGIGLFMFVQMIGAALFLGYLEMLNRWSLLLVHGITCGLLYRHAKSLSTPFQYLRQIRLRLNATVGTFGNLDWIFAAVLALFLGSAFIANLLGTPTVHDALSYRLSRIGHWLQEGSIRHFITNEDRQSYHAINASLSMLWFTAPFPHGYPLVKVPQFAGGILTLLSTLGIARLCGFNRYCQWGTLALLISMPSWTVQWMTGHSDLITAGFMSAGLYFLLLCFQTRRFFVPAWCGIALAVGAKGTVFYWGPGLVAMVGLWAVLHPANRAFWIRHCRAAIPCLVLLAFPRYVENTFHYGNPFAPKDTITSHHGSGDSSRLGEKVGLNTLSTMIQVLEPVSNPFPLNRAVNPVWRRLVAGLPDTDPYSNTALPRKPALEHFGNLSIKNADTLSSGLTVVAMALLGGVIALIRVVKHRDRNAQLWTSFAVGIGGYLFFFSALFNWWPTSFRYFNLLAPWAAVLGMVPFHFLPKQRLRIGCSMLWILASISAWDGYFHTFNSGWKTMDSNREPQDYLKVFKLQRQMIDQFPEGSRIGVALPWNQVLAGFYRNRTKVKIQLMDLNNLPRFPAAAWLMEKDLDALITSPYQPTEPKHGIRYHPTGDVASGTMYYLVHIVKK